MFGELSPAASAQPLRSIAVSNVLKSSIHSSAELAFEPAQAISLMMTAPAGNVPGVRVAVTEGLAVSIVIAVDVKVAGAVGVLVADNVGVGLEVIVWDLFGIAV